MVRCARDAFILLAWFAHDLPLDAPSPGTDRAVDHDPGRVQRADGQAGRAARLPAVYLSGGALSAGWAGLPDIGLLTLTEFAEQAAVLARATTLPLLCDADTGFGEAVNVERTVRLYEQAGAAGLHLEDQVLPKRCGHLSGKSAGRCPRRWPPRSARRSRPRRDPDFVIVARTDARSVEGFDAAVARARAYLAAGRRHDLSRGAGVGRRVRPLRRRRSPPRSWPT